jgi:hypothetical protein
MICSEKPTIPQHASTSRVGKFFMLQLYEPRSAKITTVLQDGDLRVYFFCLPCTICGSSGAGEQEGEWRHGEGEEARRRRARALRIASCCKKLLLQRSVTYVFEYIGAMKSCK